MIHYQPPQCAVKGAAVLSAPFRSMAGWRKGDSAAHCNDYLADSERGDEVHLTV